MVKLYMVSLDRVHMLLLQRLGEEWQPQASIIFTPRLMIQTFSTSSMFCLSCSSQKLKNHDGGRQIYTTSPAWTLKGRLEEMQQNRSPGPVYDASRAYKYLEQV